MLLNRSDFSEGPQHAPADMHFISIDYLLTMVRRQLKVLLLCLGIGIALGAFYLVMAPHAYFSSAMVLIDPNLQDVVDQVQQQQPIAQQTDLEDDVLNQMEVVKSGRIARAVVVAEDGSGIVGTAQVVWAAPENQPHRADVAKMLVHRRARERGIGAAVLRAAEAAAKTAGKTLLVLDTASEAAERLYTREGWQRVGAIPNYALLPNGTPCATVVFYKDLSAAS